MILMIDNYDSFTYNLVQYFGELGRTVRTFRNDAVTVGDIRKMRPERIVISPGPGAPQDAGISCDVIRELSGAVPLLGVCLGHQCIGHVFGADIVRAQRLMHGKTSLVYHSRRGIFKGVADPFAATRYHSLIIENKSVPPCLEVIARTKENEIMGIRHRTLPVWGVQFHPESIMTGEGMKILRNFIML
ncbi:MAG TPA: aminodeoxychorismate/anthranilate synthase component II [Candidatus Omnitrophota bacterium]|nr:aminodeoxychorismate/anthranilate synthase component II [Candidatus Omnitrophota bacterium]HQO38082.1 aminodeoxychorismate/anthranilate synthase component II [Candidatus Omnitrophota bacterium]HQQ06114.1 aminodeoxychorismate/anthranilate synthase component II [Candidatus Omnitrophota bacterium]